MELNKPVQSTILIVSIVILLLIGVISLFTNRLLVKDNVKSIMAHQELGEKIKDNKKVNAIFTENKVPVEALSYITESAVNPLINDGVDNLYKNKALLKENDLQDLFKESINKYEEENGVDIYNNIYEELTSTLNGITEEINNEEIISTFSFLRTISSIGYVNVVIIIVLVAIVFFVEKKNGLLISGSTLVFTSLAAYYMITNFSADILGNIDFIDADNPFLVNKIGSISETICGIFLVAGLVLIIIFIVISIRKLYREIRLKYIYKYN